MKEKLLKFLKTDHIYSGFIGGFVLAMLIILYCFITKNDNSQIIKNLTQDEIKQEITDISFSEFISILTQHEQNKLLSSDMNGSAFVYDTSQKIEEPENNEYDFVMYKRNAYTDNMAIFDTKYEYHIIKYDGYFDVFVTYYAVNENDIQINNIVNTENYQYGYIDNTFKFTDEFENNVPIQE